jgi:DNA polymerase III delta prime subunit
MKQLLVEKYRPKTLVDGFVFQSDTVETLVQKFISDGNIPNLLISGVQGTGKTTLARILIKELGIQKSDLKKVNASAENGIDQVRDQIAQFVQTFPMGKFRVVLLEEADGLSHAAQKALRSIAEEYSDTARFIFTCNYPHKIIEPIQSRCQHIHIDKLDKDAMLHRLAVILDAENITIDDLNTLTAHVDRYYPDMRRILNSIEESSPTGVLELPVNSSGEGSDVISEWEHICKTDPNLDKLIALLPQVDEHNVTQLFQILYQNYKMYDGEALQKNAVRVISKGMYQTAFHSCPKANMHDTLIASFCGIEP